MSSGLSPDNDIQITGATDNTNIGNVGDRLKVTSVPGSGSGYPSYDLKLRYEDMNASTGGVARSTSIGATFTNLYSYSSGGGLFLGCLINVQTLTDWHFRIAIDGAQLFGSDGLSMADFLNTAIYGFGDLDPGLMGLRRSANAFQYGAENGFAIRFDSSVVISGKSTGKNFQAGIVGISKD